MIYSDIDYWYLLHEPRSIVEIQGKRMCNIVYCENKIIKDSEKFHRILY